MKTSPSTLCVVLILLTGTSSALAFETKGAAGLIHRLAPGHAERFDLRDLPVTLEDGSPVSAFEIRPGRDGRIVLAGATPLDQAAAFGWYLKYVAEGQVSRAGDRIPDTFPVPEAPIAVNSPYRHRFAHNYVVHGYMAAGWGWPQWEREIDLLAAAGVNELLVVAGTERVWQLFLEGLGVPEDRIRAFLPHPVYAPWWHMGNLEGEGGPISDTLIAFQADLGRRIVARCRELGITPVLQGFVGLMPHDADTYVDGLRLVPQGTWVTGYQRPAVQDPTHEAFPRLAEAWYRALREVYGDAGTLFSGDLFHEGGKTGDVDLSAAATAIQDAMNLAAPGSVWLLQNWQGNPPPTLVAGTRPEQTRVLQLCRDMNTGTNGGPLRDFQGRPWLWAEVNNFGGNPNLYGGMPLMARMPAMLRDPSFAPGDAAGLATMSEGIQYNPMVFDLFFDLIWRDQPVDMKDWTRGYLRRRYGAAPESAVRAWMRVNRSAYAPTGIQEGCTESILCATPRRDARKASSWSSGHVYYDPLEILRAAEELLAAAPQLDATSETYRYDVVDMVRQVLADLARPRLRRAFEHADVVGSIPGSLEGFEEESRRFLELIEMTDELLATHTDWTLGAWLYPATRMGTSPEDRRQAVTLAKRIITTWNARVDALDNYANRQRAGLMRDYHLPRWRAFFDVHRAVLRGEEKPEVLRGWYGRHQAETDLAFAENAAAYTLDPRGDTLETARRILDRVAPEAEELFAEPPPLREWPWRMERQRETLVFDVNEVVTSEGLYVVKFQWKRGRSALKIHSVALYEGDRKVLEESREGWTGIENRFNTYVFPLETYRTNLDTYTLRAEVSVASAVDSEGVMTLIKR